MTVHLVPVGVAELPDFFALHDRSCFGGCYCAVWTRFGDDWAQRCAARTPNRDAMEARVQAGHHIGFLARADDRTVGWTGAGPRHCFPGLASRAGARAHVPDGASWIIGCLAFHPEARGRGFADTTVAAVVQLAHDAGAACVDAFPVRPWDEPRSYRGSERLYARHGFDEVGAEREVVVMRRMLRPR